MAKRIDTENRGGFGSKFYDRLTRQLRGLFPDDGRDEQDFRPDILRRIKQYSEKLGGPDDLQFRQKIDEEIENLWELSELKDEKGNAIYNFAGKVRKMYQDYEDMVFWLSINSNESVTTIKSFTHEERINFQHHLTKWLMEKQKRGSSRGEEEDG